MQPFVGIYVRFTNTSIRLVLEIVVGVVQLPWDIHLLVQQCDSLSIVGIFLVCVCVCIVHSQALIVSKAVASSS